MVRRSIKPAVLVALLVVVSAIGATAIVATQSGPTTGVTVDASPSDPDATSSHAVVFTVGQDATSAGAQFNRILLDYSACPCADVSNVGTGTVERLAVDYGATKVGTRFDDSASIKSVSGKKDGTAVLIETRQNLKLSSGDEVVVVLKPVQNPQNQGTPQVAVTVNGQPAAGTRRPIPSRTRPTTPPRT